MCANCITTRICACLWTHVHRCMPFTDFSLSLLILYSRCPSALRFRTEESNFPVATPCKFRLTEAIPKRLAAGVTYNKKFQSCQQTAEAAPTWMHKTLHSDAFLQVSVSSTRCTGVATVIARWQDTCRVLVLVQVITYTAIMPRVPQNASFSVPQHASRATRFGARATKAVVTVAGVAALTGLGGTLQVPICDYSDVRRVARKLTPHHIAGQPCSATARASCPEHGSCRYLDQ